MNAESGGRRRWVFATAGAVVVTGLVLALFRAPREIPVTAGPARVTVPKVKLVNLQKDEAALTDPTPLFLPTEWNAGRDALPAYAHGQPGSAFSYPANLKFARNELALTFPSDVVVPARPADALAAGKLGPTFLGLEASQQQVTQLNGRKAFVEISEARNGRRVLAEAIMDAELPSGAGAVWLPMEFLVAVDPKGLVGPPILTESSRVAAMDGYFQNYLVKTLRTGERLTPGFYRICVGP